ncbi:hypothetical protein PAERUG_E15_London_28_01_14_10041 [Pseudomonas aeruginosa]|nr:hypothetical protein PAERUG_E15_London_28_01_14_10041 [Pseudomonas aeruginosa]
MSLSLRNMVNGRMQRKTPFGPKPGALTVRTDTLVPLAVLCAVPALSE